MPQERTNIALAFRHACEYKKSAKQLCTPCTKKNMQSIVQHLPIAQNGLNGKRMQLQVVAVSQRNAKHDKHLLCDTTPKICRIILSHMNHLIVCHIKIDCMDLIHCRKISALLSAAALCNLTIWRNPLPCQFQCCHYDGGALHRILGSQHLYPEIVAIELCFPRIAPSATRIE